MDWRDIRDFNSFINDLELDDFPFVGKNSHGFGQTG